MQTEGRNPAANLAPYLKLKHIHVWNTTFKTKGKSKKQVATYNFHTAKLTLEELNGMTVNKILRKQLDIVVSSPAFVWDPNFTLTHVTFDLDPCDL